MTEIRQLCAWNFTTTKTKFRKIKGSRTFSFSRSFAKYQILSFKPSFVFILLVWSERSSLVRVIPFFLDSGSYYNGDLIDCLSLIVKTMCCWTNNARFKDPQKYTYNTRRMTHEWTNNAILSEDNVLPDKQCAIQRPSVIHLQYPTDDTWMNK